MKNIFEETNKITTDMFEYLAEIFKPLSEKELKELSEPVKGHQDTEESEDNNN